MARNRASTMQAASAAAPAAAPRHREYTAVDPRCEWARTDDADTLVVDVSGFRKEELKVLYNTSRKLKVTGERQVNGARWERFLKVFPVPRSCNSRAIRAIMDKEEALLYVILPKGSSSSPPPPSSSSIDEEKERQPGSSDQPHGEKKGGTGSADGSSSSSTGSLWSAQEELEHKIGERNKEPAEMQEKRREEIAIDTHDEPEIAIDKHDEPRTDGGGDDANVVKGEGDGEGNKNKRWWKIKPLHVLGFALILALIGVGACFLYVMLF